MDFGDYDSRKNYHVKGYNFKAPALTVETLEADYVTNLKKQKKKV